MPLFARMVDPSDAWAPFVPGNDGPWDIAAVAHLHRRAGFAAPWATLERDVKAGPEVAVNRLLEGEPASGDGTPATEFEQLLDGIDAGTESIERLRAAWLYRMIFTPHPLRERMTLFWHNHFATSNAKVNNTALMQRQNVLLRRHALGEFPPLLRAMAKDPAMLLWLDAAVNRKAHPNENYAREVMELFTLGRGHYSEKDIQEAARAFTGTFIQNDRFREVAAQHDAGEKSILGQRGAFKGDEVAGILLAQPACAEFLCGKLYRAFVSEVETPSNELIAPLAQAYRDSGYDARIPVQTILRSRWFFDASNRRKRVKSPVEFTIGTIRALEILKPTVAASARADACSRMGQALFAPPSVAGWDGGPAWINTTSTLARANFVLAVAGDSNGQLGGRFKPDELAARHGAAGENAARFYRDLLVQDALDPAVRSRIKGSPREAATLVLSAPEYQLA